MRQFSTEMRTMFRQRIINFALLAEIDHPDGLINLWSGVGTLDHDDKDWLGVGAIAGVTGVEQSAELRVSEVKFLLAHADPASLGITNTSLKNRRASLWWAGIRKDLTVVRDPILLSRIDLDYQTVNNTDDGVAVIELVGQTGFWVLERPSLASWTTEEQQKEFPGDTGFDRVPGLVDREVTWTPT